MEDRSVHSAVFVRYRAAFCLREENGRIDVCADTGTS
jgi:hypothetical protein